MDKVELGTRVNKGKMKGRVVISPGPRLLLRQYWVPALS
jgi:DNA-directed RNA polymerase beta' subunit